MSPPTKELERLDPGHKMLHIHNTCARWCFGNARCYVDANENQKPEGPRSAASLWWRGDFLATAIIMRGAAVTMTCDI